MTTNHTNHTNPAELLAVVDPQDNEIGAERRDIIHRDHLLHRAIHLFIFHPDGRLLLQQRSAQKDMYPLHWECVGGHLGPGESYEDAAIREAKEELGLELTGVQEVAKLSAGPRTDYEFITVYRAVSDAPIHPDPPEVIATDWLTPTQWREEIATRARLFSPTLLHTLEHCPQLLQ
jgi:isopentenyl-diphosphate delta-isomerase